MSRRRGRRSAATAGAAILLAVTILAAAAPLASPAGPLDQDLHARLQPMLWCGPNGVCHLAGTDQLGRDVLVRLLYGARLSLLIGFSAVAIGMVIGVAAGTLAGYRGGMTDRIIMRLADAQLAIPYVLLAIAVMALRPPSAGSLVIVLGVTGWVSYARVMRAAVRTETAKAYVAAARSLGAGHGRVMLRHVLPNSVDVAIVTAAAQFALVVLTESSMSFLGLGVPPPAPSWGSMLADGRDYLTTDWKLAALPGLALSITALGATLLSDGLRDALEPDHAGQ